MKKILTGLLVFLCAFVAASCKRNAQTSKKDTICNETAYSIEKREKSTSIEIVDIAGRTITVPTGDVKVILGESRLMIYAIAPLFGKDGNPFTHIVGWRNDLETHDPDTYEMYLKKFPEIASIPNVGNISTDFSIEKAITLNADIMIMNPYQLIQAREMGIIKKLDKVGIVR